MTASNVNFSRLNDCCDALRANPDREDFTMRVFQNPCGSPACVLGHYEHYILRRPMFSAVMFVPHMTAAADHFGVSRKDASELFGAWGCDNAKTSQEAIAYIEAFIRRHGGEVREALAARVEP